MATLKRKTNNGYEPLPAMVVRKTNAENGNGIGTCSTSSGTALTVSLTGYELVTNGIVAVTFENDVPANATLNVNNKGAKPIIYKGSAITADTIKADDTVMFAYDGTNYIVTSLGGGGGSVVFPEFITIQLTQTGGSDLDLIGATIVVTNDDTSAVILSTTWNGSNIAVQVDAGVDYTVTVGNVIGYTVTNTQSYTAVEGLQRLITFNYDDATKVDLGLPSGTKWATCNVGASSPEDYGLYFSWGNTTGYAKGSGYSFSSANYNNTAGASLTGDIVAGSAYDAARAILGAPWRIPTATEYTELNDNCTCENTTINGVAGLLLTSKNNGKTIFFPYTGQWINSTISEEGTWSGYYTTKYVNGGMCGFAAIYPTIVQPNRVDGTRHVGMVIRGIM